MQEYKHGELIQTVSANSRKELFDMMTEGSTKVVIGLIPARGEIVEINGLKFVVLSKSDKKGTIHLEILKPKKQKD